MRQINSIIFGNWAIDRVVWQRQLVGVVFEVFGKLKIESMLKERKVKMDGVVRSAFYRRSFDAVKSAENKVFSLSLMLVETSV